MSEDAEDLDDKVDKSEKEDKSENKSESSTEDSSKKKKKKGTGAKRKKSSKSKKQKKKKKNGIKRALSAYMYFCNQNRPNIKQNNPEAKFSEIGKLMGLTWKKLSPEEKKPYEASALHDKKDTKMN